MKKIFKRIGLILLILIFLALTPWIYNNIRNNFFPGKDLDISELHDEHLLLPPLIPVAEKNNAFFDIEKANRATVNSEEINKIYEALFDGKSPKNTKLILEKNKKTFKYLESAFKKSEYFNIYNESNAQIFVNTDEYKNESEKEDLTNFASASLFDSHKLAYIKTDTLIKEQKYTEAITLTTNFSELINTKSQTQNPTLIEALEFIVIKGHLIKSNSLIIKNINKFSSQQIDNFISSQKKLLKSEEIFASGMKHEYLFTKNMLLETGTETNIPFSLKPIKSIKNTIGLATMYQQQIKSCKKMHEIDKKVIKKIKSNKFFKADKNLNAITHATKMYIKIKMIDNALGKFLPSIGQASFLSYFEKKCEADKKFKESLLELINAAKTE